jgi:hypothetical protein
MTRHLLPILVGIGLAADAQQSSSADAFVARMMAFDLNHDGKLTRAEITDERLLTVFEDADANHDGIVTADELKAYYAKESASNQSREPGGTGGRGGGRGGRGGFGPPQAGQVVPGFLRGRLNLSAEQQRQLDALQKEVDAKLGRILTSDQKQLLKQGGPPPDMRR